MEQKFCQSCGMPLSPEVLGTNADGSKNEDYCMYCYKDGQFLQECTDSCKDRDLSDECMVIGTSAIIDTEIDGAVGMNSGMPMLESSWPIYRRRSIG